MKQINTYAIYLMGRWIDSVYLHARMPLDHNILAWQSARSLIDILLKGDFSLKLNESSQSAEWLRTCIDNVLAMHRADQRATLTDEQVAQFNQAFASFEQALALDLGRAPIYFVSQKGIFATTPLINSAENALTDDVREMVSDEAKEDLNQAGRCLAFAVATASGYHALRAVEKVARDYYQAILRENPGQVTMKRVIDTLRSSEKADKKTMGILDQLRDLHRNPIDHPDVFLQLPEALELFNVCTSAVSAMARQIDAIKKASTTP